MENIISKFTNKKILILGFGREGKSTLNFITKYLMPMKIGIADISSGAVNSDLISKKEELHLGEEYLNYLTDYDIVIKSPGIPNKLEELVNAKKKGVHFTSQTEIFLELFRDKTIGITGTKGKSTTSSLIHHILSRSGKNAVLVGNIGKPCLDYIDEDSQDVIFVFEMSSHQLSDLKVSPHIGIFLNIFPEHLDYYLDFEDYFKAKTNIANFQSESDYFIYNSDFPQIARFSESVKSMIVAFNNIDANDFDLSKIKLKGDHNKLNIYAAIETVKLFNIDSNQIQKALVSFSPLETRLEEVGEVDSIKFISDSLSTIPQSADAAAKAFSLDKVVQILGGMDRGIDLTYYKEEYSKNKNVAGVILIGELADKLEIVFKESGFSGEIVNMRKESFESSVLKSYQMAKSLSSSVVLLSPGATSFDMFKDYKDRADQFKSSVLKLKSVIK